MDDLELERRLNRIHEILDYVGQRISINGKELSTEITEQELTEIYVLSKIDSGIIEEF